MQNKSCYMYITRIEIGEDKILHKVVGLLVEHSFLLVDNHCSNTIYVLVLILL